MKASRAGRWCSTPARKASPAGGRPQAQCVFVGGVGWRGGTGRAAARRRNGEGLGGYWEGSSNASRRRLGYADGARTACKRPLPAGHSAAAHPWATVQARRAPPSPQIQRPAQRSSGRSRRPVCWERARRIKRQHGRAEQARRQPGKAGRWAGRRARMVPGFQMAGSWQGRRFGRCLAGNSLAARCACLWPGRVVCQQVGLPLPQAEVHVHARGGGVRKGFGQEAGHQRVLGGHRRHGLLRKQQRVQRLRCGRVRQRNLKLPGPCAAGEPQEERGAAAGITLHDGGLPQTDQAGSVP